MTSDILKSGQIGRALLGLRAPTISEMPTSKLRFSNYAFWIFQDCAISNNSIKYNSIVLPSEIFREVWNIWGFRLLFMFWKWHNPQEFHKASTEMRIFLSRYLWNGWSVHTFREAYDQLPCSGSKKSIIIGWKYDKSNWTISECMTLSIVICWKWLDVAPSSSCLLYTSDAADE